MSAVATAARDAEAHAVQREHAGEAFGDALKLDERHCRRNVFPVWKRGARENTSKQLNQEINHAELVHAVFAGTQVASQ